jgi:S-methylmethionine-dependent homocysteine/selenocysteine methylase
MAVEILDGAVGTELIARGWAFDGPQWTACAAVDDPSLLTAVHRDYARAGATLHTANTFRTQPGAYGEGWGEALAAAVRVARSAIPEIHRVAGSIAPVADCYRPDLSPGEGARETHRLVACALAAEGCDVLLCETFAHGVEPLVAAEEAVRTGLPTWLSLTAGPFGDLLSPEELRRIAKRAVSTGIERLLINCVSASRAQPYVEAIADLGAAFGVYANAGSREEALGWDATGGRAAEAYAAHAQGWVDAGASLIGGCCGTRPLHIAALAARFG